MPNIESLSVLDKKCLEIFCLKNTKEQYQKLNPSCTSKKYINKHIDEFKEEFNYMNNKFKYLGLTTDNNLSEILYRIKYHIIDKQYCPVCGKELKFHGFVYGFGTVCSTKCNMKDKNSIEKFKKSISKNPKYYTYNAENNYDYEHINKDVDEYVLKCFLIKQKNGHIVLDSNKYYINSKWCQKHKKLVNYILNRYSDSNTIEENIYRLLNNINIKPTCVTCGKSVKFVKFAIGYQKHCCHSCCTKDPNVQEKHKKTMKQRYGVEYTLQSNELRQKVYKTISNRIAENYYNNPKSEVTQYSSRGEKLIFNTLKEKYPDILQYYRDNRYASLRTGYQFECDFYIPSLDLFIEYQGFPTHGTHPYNKNDENDKNELLELKKQIKYCNENNKSDSFYKAKIDAWTKGDVYKRNIAKWHNLNYIEFFEDYEKLSEDLILNKVNEYIKNGNN